MFMGGVFLLLLFVCFYRECGISQQNSAIFFNLSNFEIVPFLFIRLTLGVTVFFQQWAEEPSEVCLMRTGHDLADSLLLEGLYHRAGFVLAELWCLESPPFVCEVCGSDWVVLCSGLRSLTRCVSSGAS